MHCLGAGAGGQATPSGLGSHGGVVSVIRALGVLVCEGRIQGPPRGYKEGPHCVAPLQTTPNNHICQEENYLCDRYQTLVKEIDDRVSIGSFLCVEVLLCSDCPCGLLKTRCTDPLFPASTKSTWQSSSEMLLEYWCIGNILNKSPETMNSHGLYQAVRSRLHFSQLAAWWSRSNGTKPVNVATRVVPYNEDNLRKFREAPVEHTFPLASSGDGNSIKVTVWALPRMEEVPVLTCSLHPIKEEEGNIAQALTPTKIIPIPSAFHAPDALVLPALLDDRLQTPCDKSGKHDCRCEEEDGCPPSPSIRPNGERKRRRSLPCGPSEIAVPCTAVHPPPLTSVQETTTRDLKEHNSKFNYAGGNLKSELSLEKHINENCAKNNNNPHFDNLEHCLKTFSIEEKDGNFEKRYKRSVDNPDQLEMGTASRHSGDSHKHEAPLEAGNAFLGRVESPTTHVPSKFLGMFAEPWGSCRDNNTNSLQNINNQRRKFNVNVDKKVMSEVSKEANFVINPFHERSSFHESNPGPSSYVYNAHPCQLSYPTPPLTCTVHQPRNRTKQTNYAVSKPSNHSSSASSLKTSKNPAATDLSHLMSKLSFPEEKNKCKEEGILEWISKVPGRVLGVMPNSTTLEDKSKISKIHDPRANDIKVKNCNLELSQREFDEVLAVLRARTPSGRRRVPVKNLRKRDRIEKQSSKSNFEGSDVVSECETSEIYSYEDCVCTSCKKNNQQNKFNSINSVESCNLPSYPTQEKILGYGGKHVCLRLKNSEDRSKTDYIDSFSNKADVLLGAILRTSKDKKGLADISNGTRPRTMLIDESEKNKKVNEALENEKALPSTLNKRLIQFRQLFKREERPDLLTLEDHSKEGLNAQQAQQDKNTVKRRIDFSNEKSDSQELVDSPGTSLLSSHTNLKFHSTNHANEEFKVNGQTSLDDITLQKVQDRFQGINGILKPEDKEGNEFVHTQVQQMKMGVLISERSNDDMSSKLQNNQNNFTEEDEILEKMVPSVLEQERFRRSLENAASMVFHSRTGLPLTSSPAPLRKGSSYFDFDSSLNSVSSKRSALFELNTPPSPGAVSLEETDRETENVCEGEETERRRSTSHSRPQSHALLGNFEESALNGRLEPVSTVHGFTAEIGASGSFCPKHRKLPVTVFFYTLGDNDKVSTPYLAHINLGKKGYQVPRSGTVQVTLLNPLGTVVKMFVVLYDLSDMPPRSHTFLRQRTLRDKTLRYLIHLRFMSGKSGRIYLHTDIRMIICRKADVDTASDFGTEPPHEVRSYNHGPTHPKFSPRC